MTPGSQAPRRIARLRHFLLVHPRILSLMLNAWGVLIGSLAVLACVVFFIDPNSTLDRTSVNTQLGGWDDAWSVMYGLGGAMMVYGIVRPDRAVDVAGLCLFAGATMINLTAIMILSGGRVLSVLPYVLGCFLAAVARAVVLVVLADTPVVPRIPPTGP